MTISDTACFISTRVTVPNTLVTPMKARTTTLQVNQVFDFIQLFMAASFQSLVFFIISNKRQSTWFLGRLLLNEPARKSGSRAGKLPLVGIIRAILAPRKSLSLPRVFENSYADLALLVRMQN